MVHVPELSKAPYVISSGMDAEILELRKIE